MREQKMNYKKYLLISQKVQNQPHDIIFVYTTNHGAPEREEDGSILRENTYLCTWMSEEDIKDDDFAKIVDTVTSYGYEIFLFDQCYGGGLIDELLNQKRVFITAANWFEPSKERYFCKAWNEGVNGAADNALHGKGDGDVTMDEAYRYALANDEEACSDETHGPEYDCDHEHPQYIDPGSRKYW